MAITARKLKRLRKEKKVSDRREREDLLMRLGAEQGDLLSRLGRNGKINSVCRDCGLVFEFQGLHFCPALEKRIVNHHEREKFFKRMGIEKKSPTLAERWAKMSSITITGRTPDYGFNLQHPSRGKK